MGQPQTCSKIQSSDIFDVNPDTWSVTYGDYDVDFDFYYSMTLDYTTLYGGSNDGQVEVHISTECYTDIRLLYSLEISDAEMGDYCHIDYSIDAGNNWNEIVRYEDTTGSTLTKLDEEQILPDDASLKKDFQLRFRANANSYSDKCIFAFVQICGTPYPCTDDPTSVPTSVPTAEPTMHPTMPPTLEPTVNPTTNTAAPTYHPTTVPTTDPVDPTTTPTIEYTLNPTIGGKIDGKIDEGTQYNHDNGQSIDEDIYKNDKSEGFVISLWMLLVVCVVSILLTIAIVCCCGCGYFRYQNRKMKAAVVKIQQNIVTNKLQCVDGAIVDVAMKPDVVNNAPKAHVENGMDNVSDVSDDSDDDGLWDQPQQTVS